MSLTLLDGLKQNLPRRLINTHWIRSGVAQAEREAAHGEEGDVKFGLSRSSCSTANMIYIIYPSLNVSSIIGWRETDSLIPVVSIFADMLKETSDNYWNNFLKARTKNDILGIYLVWLSCIKLSEHREDLFIVSRAITKVFINCTMESDKISVQMSWGI